MQAFAEAIGAQRRRARHARRDGARARARRLRERARRAARGAPARARRGVERRLHPAARAPARLRSRSRSGPARLSVAEEGAPPVLTLTFDSQAALADEPDRAAVRDVTLAFDVPQTDSRGRAVQGLAGRGAGARRRHGRRRRRRRRPAAQQRRLRGDRRRARPALRRARGARSRRRDRRPRGACSAEENGDGLARFARCRAAGDPGADGRRAGRRARDRRLQRRRPRLAAVRDARTRRRSGARSRRSAPQTSAPFNLNFFCHRPPVVDSAREAAWRQALAPYYREHGLDIATVPVGGGRFPFDAASAGHRRGASARRSSASTTACPTPSCSLACARPERASSPARRRSTRRSGSRRAASTR